MFILTSRAAGAAKVPGGIAGEAYGEPLAPATLVKRSDDALERLAACGRVIAQQPAEQLRADVGQVRGVECERREWEVARNVPAQARAAHGIIGARTECRCACPVLNSHRSSLVATLSGPMLITLKRERLSVQVASQSTLESAEPRCPNCSSLNTKPLSFNTTSAPHAVYACRVCGHVWRLSRPTPPQQP